MTYAETTKCKHGLILIECENMVKIHGTIGYINWDDDQQVYKATILLDKDEARKIRVGKANISIKEIRDKQKDLKPERNKSFG